MDPFDFGIVKAEKANAMRRYNLFAAIFRTLRILELCVALLLLSWILTRLPFAVRISGEYIRILSAFVGSPLFVFAISNAIIAALVAQSGRFTAQDSAGGDNADLDAGLYQEFLKNSSADRAKSPSEADAPSCVAVAEEVEVEYQDKQIISETNTTVARTVQNRDSMDVCTDHKNSDTGSDTDFPNYRRSHSEKWKGEAGKMLRRKLQQSETEKHRENPREKENLYPQDKLSNEEFQRTIEAFIAKQMRFLREESSAIVVQNQS